jgi:hypothetical protein
MRRLLPAGECWCGCDEETLPGSFFRPGHDRSAESMLIQMKFGGVAEFLDHHGYGPRLRNLRRDYEGWLRKQNDSR